MKKIKEVFDLKTVIHCDVYPKAQLLIHLAENQGLKWWTGREYKNLQNDYNWKTYKEKTCYNGLVDCYDKLSAYETNGRKIISFDEFLKKVDINSNLFKIINKV